MGTIVYVTNFRLRQSTAIECLTLANIHVYVLSLLCLESHLSIRLEGSHIIVLQYHSTIATVPSRHAIPTASLGHQRHA